jgi:hypothetical protein
VNFGIAEDHRCLVLITNGKGLKQASQSVMGSLGEALVFAVGPPNAIANQTHIWRRATSVLALPQPALPVISRVRPAKSTLLKMKWSSTPDYAPCRLAADASQDLETRNSPPAAHQTKTRMAPTALVHKANAEAVVPQMSR